MTDGALDAESHRLNIAEKTIREFAEKMSEPARGLDRAKVKVWRAKWEEGA